MGSYSFKITGQKELLQKLDLNKQKMGVKEAVKKHTALMQSKAQQLAPVDTGFLKRGIASEMSSDGMQGRVNSVASYSGFQEFGTRFMGAQPFMGPAFRQERPLFISDLLKLVK